MKKSNLKLMLKNRDKFIAEQAKQLEIQFNSLTDCKNSIKKLLELREKQIINNDKIIQKYKSFIKDLEHQLTLAAELAEKKDEEIEKLHNEIVKNKTKIPFIKETEHALFCAEYIEVKKEVVDAPATFSSRFMPNVKFKIIGNTVAFSSLGIPMTCNYIRTSFNGSIVDMCNYQGRFDDEWKDIKEVSIYEAIPELVPKGMIYNKKNDSLIKKVCVNPLCQGEFCDCDPSFSFEKDNINFA